MKIVGSIISTIGCALILTSCASSNPPATPVKVTVSGSHEVGKGMDQDLRDATLSAIAKRVPHAGSLIVAVILDRANPGSASVARGFGGFDSPAPQPRVVPSTNPNPSADGAQPTVPSYGGGAYALTASQDAELHGSYTITSPQGRILEAKRLDFSQGSVRALLKQTGDFIASRVQSFSN